MELATQPKISKAILVLGISGVVFGVWYLGLGSRRWIFESDYMKLMTSGEVAREWITRFFYAIPKLGAIVGLISLFKFRRYSFRIYAICWAFALAHTGMYYFAYDATKFNDVEWLRLAVHHIIPHTFFLVMLFTLKSTGATANKRLWRQDP